MRLAAAPASPAVQPVFVHPRLDWRNLEDLMALRPVIQLDFTAALAYLQRLAVHRGVNLGFIKHRAAVALVAWLRTTLASTGPALRPVELARTVRRRRLGRVVGVEADPLFQDHHTRLQLVEQ